MEEGGGGEAVGEAGFGQAVCGRPHIEGWVEDGGLGLMTGPLPFSRSRIPTSLKYPWLNVLSTPWHSELTREAGKKRPRVREDVPDVRRLIRVRELNRVEKAPVG